MAIKVTSTFSIVAIDPGEGAVGSAVASCSLAVGAVVPYVKRKVGAVNTQHYACPRLAREILERMSRGMEPQGALNDVLQADKDSENRQIIAISMANAKCAWTGKKCLKPNNFKIGRQCVAAGNRLADESVVDAMVDAFDNSEGIALAERLLQSLEAGWRRGGDSLGHESAALSVVPEEINEGWPANLIDLRVDHHAEPIRELHRIYDVFALRNKR